ncbi:hypothetical protein D3C81_1230240 [compost metagenome]
MMNKTAADLGERNIPREMLDTISPEALQVLFWREQSSNPVDTTVELWRSASGSFLVFAGYYDGTWAEQNIQYLQDTKGPLFESLESGLAAIKRSYSFGEIEEPHEQNASYKVKRLIKRN